MNNIFEGKVRSMSSEGAGVVEHPDGFVVFVPGVWIGDIAEIEIVQKKKKFARGKFLKLLEPSSERVNPACAHFGVEEGKCGGCPWQIASYDAQLKVKQAQVVRSFIRLGVGEDQIKKIIGSENEWGYRNRAQLKTDGKKLGYISAQTHVLAPVEDCIVLTDSLRGKLKELQKQLPQGDWVDPDDHWFSSIGLDDDLNTQSVFPNAPMKFKQANDSQNEYMKKWISSHIDESTKSAVELFSGAGNFTEVLVEAGLKSVLALEGSDEAIDSLRLKNHTAVEAVVENLFKEDFVSKFEKEISNAQLLLLDPPRDGWKNKTKFFESAKNLEKIVYVSCHLATLVRDLTDFVEQGFVIEEVQPVDQFPQSPHIEVLVMLRKG